MAPSQPITEDREAIFSELLGPDRIRTMLHSIRDLQNGRSVVGHEALMRGPKGMPFESPPLAFAMAATMGMLEHLDTNCVRLAARVKTKHQLFINVHPRTIVGHREFWSLVGEIADSGPRSPHEIVFEIVEHSTDHDSDLAHSLRELRGLGFGLAVDDLGEGAAGMRRVVETEPDFVKIDRFFISGIDSNPRKRSVVNGIAAMSRELGAKVIAEGIDTENELQVLADIGIELGQGFYFERPEEVA